jgi:hypothetical protein
MTTTHRFVVPAGTRCGVRTITQSHYGGCTTESETGFDRYERVIRNSDGKHYEFRSDVGGLMMLVDARFVVTDHAIPDNDPPPHGPVDARGPTTTSERTR